MARAQSAPDAGRCATGKIPRQGAEASGKGRSSTIDDAGSGTRDALALSLHGVPARPVENRVAHSRDSQIVCESRRSERGSRFMAPGRQQARHAAEAIQTIRVTISLCLGQRILSPRCTHRSGWSTSMRAAGGPSLGHSDQ